MAEKQCSSSGCTKESCEGCPSKNKPTSFQVASNEYTKVKHVIGVVSGKGGVGKSMVTASLANLMAEKGYRVGILDADITGPSIPKMYGLHGPAQADDNGIYPPLAENDIKVMSINLLMPDEEAPVIWRGPVISGMVKAGVFGFIISIMGCYHGYRSKGGAQGVGEATTNAVVSSSILILIFNYLITELFFSK